jgi:hypothetical protein
MRTTIIIQWTETIRQNQKVVDCYDCLVLSFAFTTGTRILREQSILARDDPSSSLEGYFDKILYFYARTKLIRVQS